jgi:tryptophan-rich sensory protein
MKKQAWKYYVGWVLVAEAVGVLVKLLTAQGEEIYMATVQQPALSPPPIVFPIVWSILYALMGIGAARVQLADAGKARTMALWAFGVQLAWNFVWSLIFFNAQAFGAALAWIVALWLLIVWMVAAFYRVIPWAGWLQIPYLLWVSFAAYLNLCVWQINR